MKVFLAQSGQPDEVETVGGPWWTPWTVGAVQSTTREALGAAQCLAEEVDGADLVLCEAVDRWVPLMGEALADLKRQASEAGAALAVRLHGAWRTAEADPCEDDPADLGALWEHADHVLFGSRNHLVRVASEGKIDASRSRLAPVALRASISSEERGDLARGRFKRILVAGEMHRGVVRPVLEAVAELAEQAEDGESSPEARLVNDYTSFRSGLAEASVLAVPAAGSFGDRCLVDAALRLGVPVVAAEGASSIDTPLPAGLNIVTRTGSSAAWAECMGAALADGLVPMSSDPEKALDHLLERQLNSLRAICDSRRGPGQGNCPPQAAA